ncbi:hypothetical protein HWAG_00841 [Helicobacter winghamensis ATCC BAA-430]|nr:hypothetical protein HWAG_00841 [Helicobacter winghamensis ATCC BAA-430]
MEFCCVRLCDSAFVIGALIVNIKQKMRESGQDIDIFLLYS